jgi:hypothetical protein
MAMRHPITVSPRTVAGWLLATLILGPTGCSHLSSTRAQAPDEGEAKFDLKEVQTIGDVTEPSGALPMQVTGIGLVTGLPGTGGGAPPNYRAMLQEQLLKAGVRHAKEVLESPDNALVLVTALIPAGCRKGDPIDVEISLPPGSGVTSLRGGELQECVLRNYDSARHLNPNSQGDKLLPGHILAKARGPLLVGFGPEEDEAERLRHGRIWDGGVSLIDRPFYFVLKSDQNFARVANSVAGRINQLFPDDARKRAAVLRNRNFLVLQDVTDQLNNGFKPNLGKGETARAVTKDMVYVQVPCAYHLNPERYLRVARLIPLRESPEARGRYRQHLHDLLLDPTKTMVAALRLEALGKESVPALKDGLTHEHPLVRFAAAESLAYLDCGTGAAELGRLAEQYEALRAYSMAALASLEQPASRLKLTEMMSSPNAEVRYGGFKALRILNETWYDEAVAGELLGDSFWLHRVAPRSSPLVHISTTHRAEIVCFGEEPRLVPPLKILAGEFTIAAAPGDTRCTIGRFIVNPPSWARKQCSLKLDDVLKKMAELGGAYPDAVELLRQADRRKCLTAPVVVDATPITVSVEELANEGKKLRHLAEPAEVSSERTQPETSVDSLRPAQAPVREEREIAAPVSERR